MPFVLYTANMPFWFHTTLRYTGRFDQVYVSSYWYEIASSRNTQIQHNVLGYVNV